jgi:hypothetical protein
MSKEDTTMKPSKNAPRSSRFLTFASAYLAILLGIILVPGAQGHPGGGRPRNPTSACAAALAEFEAASAAYSEEGKKADKACIAEKKCKVDKNGFIDYSLDNPIEEREKCTACLRAKTKKAAAREAAARTAVDKECGKEVFQR